MNPSYGMRLLWAEALDSYRTAIVIQYDNRLLGGVAFMRKLTVELRHPQNIYGMDGHFRLFPDYTSADMCLDMTFEWYEVVDSADAFRRSKRWQEARQQAQIEYQKKLPPP